MGWFFFCLVDLVGFFLVRREMRSTVVGTVRASEAELSLRGGTGSAQGELRLTR